MGRMVLSLVAATAAAILVGCSAGISVNTDYDKAFDFSKLKTFKVQLGPTGSTSIAGVSPLTTQRVQAAIEAELKAKGYTKAEGDSADFVAVARGGTQEEVSEGSWGYAGYWDGPLDSYTYLEGTLVIDIVDLASKKAVWHGVGKDIVGDKGVEEAKIGEAVGTMLNDFPPGINAGAK